ncbi:hypothetical protein OG373_22415 [Streptomyces avidinii]|uniref:hypothetical protein n=1 Tax=Streptomyces avidinii TaxID=1895 RepID=UPI00386BB2A5|nr:hypothetical protein OG373_22415 [Streptomyces avidinii]
MLGGVLVWVGAPHQGLLDPYPCGVLGGVLVWVGAPHQGLLDPYPCGVLGGVLVWVGAPHQGLLDPYPCGVLGGVLVWVGAPHEGLLGSARAGTVQPYGVVAPRPAGTLLRVPAPRPGFGSTGHPRHRGWDGGGEWGRAGVSPQDEARPPRASPRCPRAPSRGDTPARPHAPTPADPAAPSSLAGD